MKKIHFRNLITYFDAPLEKLQRSYFTTSFSNETVIRSVSGTSQLEAGVNRRTSILYKN